jgi:hypothetical protein
VTRPRQPLWLNGAHLLALWSFALVQPLFDLLGRNADFFVARGSTSGDIVFFAIVVTLGPPLLAFGLEVLVGLASPRAREALHLALVALLAGVIVLGFVKKAVDGSSGVLIPLSLAAGAGVALWYARDATVRRFATVLAAAPALFLFVFLFTSPVHKLVRSGEAHAQAAKLDSRTPVIMVSFDEFPLTSLTRPDGSLDARRYPNFARFARQSVWFRNTTTVADGTRWATPIVISGKLPARDALPTYQDYPQNLFTVLGGGYRLNVTEPVTRLCPRELCADTGPRESEATGQVQGGGDAQDATQDKSFGERMGSLASDLGIVSLHLVLPDDLRERLPSVSEQLGDFGKKAGAPAAIPKRRPAPVSAAARRRQRRAAGRRLNELIPTAKDAERAAPAFPRFLRRIRPYSGAGKPPLYFLHVLLPHHPWRLLPSGRSYGESVPPNPGLRDNQWNSDDVAVEQGWQRHMLQVGYVDRALGRLMARLRATGLWNRSLVVLTADHGVAFGVSSPRRKITQNDVGGIAPVPFFVKLPGARRGRVVDEHVETIDVLPTIADALDFELPEQTDGHSALSPDYRGHDGVRIWSTTSTREFERLDVPWRDFLTRRALVNVRQQMLFGTGDRKPELLWAVGPHFWMVGRAVPEGAAVLPVRVTYDRPEELESWTPDAGWTPSHVSGRIDGLEAGRELALEVNGRVGAVGRTYEFGGETRFSLMVAEEMFRAGHNELTLFSVEPSQRGVRIMQLGG